LIVSEAVASAESLAEAVIVGAPTLKVDTAVYAPPPGTPSMLEAYLIEESIEPSAGSLDRAPNPTRLPCVNEAPSDGLSILTVGDILA
jgi:hypothetical protein